MILNNIQENWIPFWLSTMRIQPLTQLGTSRNATVVRLKLDPAEQTRLTQLGLRCGATVKILQANEGAPLLLAVGDSRIGLNYQTAQNVYVAA